MNVYAKSLACAHVYVNTYYVGVLFGACIILLSSSVEID